MSKHWRTSSRSSGGNCVEASMPQWRKSTYSSDGACVEVAALGPDQVGVRDSKDPHGPTLWFTPAEWQAFLAGVRDGEFDLERPA